MSGSRPDLQASLGEQVPVKAACLIHKPEAEMCLLHSFKLVFQLFNKTFFRGFFFRLRQAISHFFQDLCVFFQ
jgi:hypothetical protein